MGTLLMNILIALDNRLLSVGSIRHCTAKAVNAGLNPFVRIQSKSKC